MAGSKSPQTTGPENTQANLKNLKPITQYEKITKTNNNSKLLTKSTKIKIKSRTNHTKPITNTSPGSAISNKVQCPTRPRSAPKFTIATINGFGIMNDSKLQNYIDRFAQDSIDIIAIQEFHRQKSGECLVSSIAQNLKGRGEQYEVYWVGAGHVNRYQGVGFAIRKNSNIEIVQEPTKISPRVMHVTVRVWGQLIKIVNGYAPTELKDRKEKLAFYRDLKKGISSQSLPEGASKKSQNKVQLMVVGDFNAKISAAKYTSHLSHLNVDKLPNLTYSENGELLLDTIRDFSLFNLNTAFTHKRVRRETRINPNQNNANQIIDYINCSSWLRKLATNCRVYRSIIDKTLSDHRILISTFRLPPCRKERKQQRRTKFRPKPPKADPIMKLNLDALKVETIRHNFIQNLQRPTTKNPQTDDLSKLNKQLLETLKTAALDSVPPKPKKVKAEAPWLENAALVSLFEERKSKLLSKQKLTEINKKIKRLLIKLENDYYWEKANEINVLHEQRQVEKEFKKVKEMANHSMFKPLTATVGCPLPKLRGHFQQHFNLDPLPQNFPPELNNPPEYITKLRHVGNYESINQEPPTQEEIHCQVMKMKNNKAASDIPAEFLKAAADNDPNTLKALEDIFKLAWEGNEVPEDWGEAKIECLYKNKGKRGDPKMYRGLSITSTVSKLYMMILVERLSPWYNEQLDLSQNGFRKGLGTVDAILRNKNIQRLAVKTGQEVYATFIDLSAAFDTVIRSWIFQAMRVRIPEGQSSKIIDLLEIFYSKTSAYLKMDPDKQAFSTNLGVRQGGVESPLLFCFYLDHVMRVYEHKLDEANITPPIFKFRMPTSATSRAQSGRHKYYGSSSEPWNGYADDTTLYNLSVENQQKSLEILSQIYDTYYLKLNISKTQTMIYNSQSPVYPTSTISLQSLAIENVDTFKFLGSLVNKDEIGVGEVELNSRIQSANGKFHEYKKVLQNPKIKIRTKMIYFNSLIRSRLTYASSSWHLTKTQQDKVDRAQRKLLRKMVRGGYSRVDEENGNFDFKISTNKLLKICGTTNISEYIQKGQVKFAGHIVRAENSTKNKQLLFNVDSNRKTGHPVPNLIADAAKIAGSADLNQFCRDQRFGRNL